MVRNSLQAAVLLASSLLIGLSACSSEATSIASSSTETFTMVVGMEANYAPFNWTGDTYDSEHSVAIKGQPGQYAYGYDVDVARYIAEYNDWNLNIVKTDWDSLIPFLQAGTINAILAGMTDTAEREQSIDFSAPYYQSELVLIAQNDNSAFADDSDFDLNGLSGMTLIAQRSTVEDDLIGEWESSFGVVHGAATDTFAIAAQLILNGSADAVPAEYPVAAAIVAATPGLKVVHFDQSLLSEEIRNGLSVSIGLKKNDPDHMEDGIANALSDLSQETRDQWMIDATERSQA